MIIPPGVSVVLFDLDDTLIDHHSAARAAAVDFAREVGVDGTPADLAERWLSIERTWFAAYERGEVTYAGQRAARCREFTGRNLSDDDALRLYDSYLAAYARRWQAFPDAAPALRAASARYQVGILTNGDARMQTDKLRRTGLDLPGIRMLASAQLGVAKPQPEIYARAVALLGCQPAEALMIGDHPVNDVAAARAAGLHAVHIDRRAGASLADLHL